MSKSKRRSKINVLALLTLILAVVVVNPAQGNINSLTKNKITKSKRNSFVNSNITYRNKSQDLVYITIDDGFYLNYKARSYILANNLPVTYFIIAKLFKNPKYLAYFKPLLTPQNTGNHTYNHALLTRKNLMEDKKEICSANTLIKNMTGINPIYFRSPFGATTSNVISDSRSCGFAKVTL